jgi:hypothetical protein
MSHAGGMHMVSQAGGMHVESHAGGMHVVSRAGGVRTVRVRDVLGGSGGEGRTRRGW